MRAGIAPALCRALGRADCSWHTAGLREGAVIQPLFKLCRRPQECLLDLNQETLKRDSVTTLSNQLLMFSAWRPINKSFAGLPPISVYALQYGTQ
jgi:hypothetical protein